MSELKLNRYDLIIYPLSVWTAVDCSDKYLTEIFGDVPSLDLKLAAYVCNVQGGVLIRFRNKECMTAQYIAHEATHAALYIFEQLGCNVTFDNQEPFAFLVDSIVCFTHNLINNNERD